MIVLTFEPCNAFSRSRGCSVFLICFRLIVLTFEPSPLQCIGDSPNHPYCCLFKIYLSSWLFCIYLRYCMYLCLYFIFKVCLIVLIILILPTQSNVNVNHCICHCQLMSTTLLFSCFYSLKLKFDPSKRQKNTQGNALIL